MNIVFIIVTFNTPSSERERLEKDIGRAGFGTSKIEFIDNSRNKKGYAAGINKGLQKSFEYGDIFVMLNPDISLRSIRKDDIIKLTQTFDIGGFAMEQNGTVYYGGIIDKWRLSGGLIEKKPSVMNLGCDFVTGSFMVVKKNVFEKIGFFDERFFMYYEDVDFCVRARSQGFSVGVDTVHIYNHLELSKHNPEKEKLLANARWRFFFKYATPLQKLREFARLPKTFTNSLVNRSHRKG